MPTLKAIRQEMVRRPGPSLGRVEIPASATTSTLVVTRLITGGSNQTYASKWLLRPDAASQPADRQRLVGSSGFTASSGTFAISPVYTDVTVTSEAVEILEYEPYLYDNAIQTAIQKLHGMDRYDMPARTGVTRYYLGELSWLNSITQVDRVTVCNSPVLTKNRFFEDWNGVDTGGVLTADYWTLAGSAATATRSITSNRRGSYTVALVRAGTNATYTQTIGLLDVGQAASAGTDLRGRTVGIVLVGTASSANQLRISVTDGTQTVNSSFHSGGGAVEELSTTITVASTATTLTVAMQVNVDGTCYVDEAYACLEAVTDSVRKDYYPEDEVRFEFDQGAGTLQMILPTRNLGRQFRIYTKRPYSGFDPTRLAGGTADSDSTDAPLVHVVAGALGQLYDNLAQQGGTENSRWAALAGKWKREFQVLAQEHLYQKSVTGSGGVTLARYAGVPVRR